MSTRDWKLGEVVYLKSGSPAMTVIGTDQHGATTVRWYDPQAIEAERTVYPTVVFPKDCLTEAVTPIVMDEKHAYPRSSEPLAAEILDWSQNFMKAQQALNQGLILSIQQLQTREMQPDQLVDRLLACPMQTWPSESSRALRDRLRQVRFVDDQVVGTGQEQPSEKIVEATARAAEPQRSEQSTAQTTVQRSAGQSDQRQSPLDQNGATASAALRERRKNS